MISLFEMRSTVELIILWGARWVTKTMNFFIRYIEVDSFNLFGLQFPNL